MRVQLHSQWRICTEKNTASWLESSCCKHSWLYYECIVLMKSIWFNEKLSQTSDPCDNPNISIINVIIYIERMHVGRKRLIVNKIYKKNWHGLNVFLKFMCWKLRLQYNHIGRWRLMRGSGRSWGWMA